MSRLARVGRGVWEFIVGDDWRVAVGVVAALGVTAVIAGAGGGGWWIMPPAVVLLLGESLRRASRRSP